MIMSRRRHRRFTESQLEQHQSLGYQLQRVNAIAAQGLIKLHRLSPAHQHYEQAYRDLAEAVRSMKLHSHCCESIVANSWVTYTRINVIHGNVCEPCLVNPKSANDSYGQVKLFKKLNPNPGWRIQVEALLSLTNLAINRIVERMSFFPAERKCAQCLCDLDKAMRRQQLHLDKIGSLPTTEIRQIDDFESKNCRRCGNPFGSVPDTGPRLRV